MSTHNNVHGPGALSGSASIVGETYGHPTVSLGLTLGDATTVYYLENSAQDLSTTAAALRVLANRIDELSDDLRPDRIRASLPEGCTV